MIDIVFQSLRKLKGETPICCCSFEPSLCRVAIVKCFEGEFASVCVYLPAVLIKLTDMDRIIDASIYPVFVFLFLCNELNLILMRVFLKL